MKSSRPSQTLASRAELFLEAPTTIGNDQIEFGAQLIEDSKPTERIWFRFPSTYSSLLTRRADPFVIATAVHTSRRYQNLHVHGSVSDGLFANLAEFQAAFSAFHKHRRAQPVVYTASEVAAPVGPGRRATGITAFSGGVDSCFSVFRHTALSSLAPKRKLGGSLMMHGFDIPLEQPVVFKQSANRSRRMTEEAGLRLYTGATNIRILPVPWEDTFAAAVAGSLSFFQPAFSYGLVPSFQEWSQARFDHGSNPLTDPLLSSPSFQIVHDGAGFGRIEKLRHLAAWPGSLRNLRVCWQGPELDRNCCTCEKCLRTMLMLDVCGISRSEAFPDGINPEAVSRLVIKNQSGLDEFGYLLEEAHRLNLERPWIKPAEHMLKRNRRNRVIWEQGQSFAGFIPADVRRALRDVGHRWLWKTPHAQRTQTAAASAAAVGAQ